MSLRLDLQVLVKAVWIIGFAGVAQPPARRFRAFPSAALPYTLSGCSQSEDRLLNRTEAKYDTGDSSPTSGFRKLLSHRFQMEEVDEYLTSKTCCHCHGRLERYSMDPKG